MNLNLTYMYVSFSSPYHTAIAANDLTMWGFFNHNGLRPLSRVVTRHMAVSRAWNMQLIPEPCTCVWSPAARRKVLNHRKSLGA